MDVPPSHTVKRQENVAEHSWSVSLAVRTFWENRAELGITFGDNFDIGLALAAADVHDVGESIAGDVDAMIEDPSILIGRQDREITAFHKIGINNQVPRLVGKARHRNRA